jgi:hypothetical protein
VSPWLAQIGGDAMLSDDSRELAQTMIERFGTSASGYVNFHDVEAAAIMNVSIGAVARARRELVSRGHLIPLAGRMSMPSFKLSTCRW